MSHQLSSYHLRLFLIVLLLPFMGTCTKKSKPVIGILQYSQSLDVIADGVKSELSNLGYEEDKDIAFFYRNAELDSDQLVKNIEEMIEARVDMIMALTTPAAMMAKQHAANAGIPVVVSLVGDPVSAGLVPDLSGHNQLITGVTTASNLLMPKRLEVLLEIDPGVKRVLVVHSDMKTLLPGIEALRETASLLNIELMMVSVHTVEEARAAYANVMPGSIDAVFIPSDAIVGQAVDALRSLLEREKIPSVGEVGNSNASIIAYGPTLQTLSRQTAIILVKMIKGASLDALPIERPREYKLTLSLRNANAIGYTFRDEALALADVIIE